MIASFNFSIYVLPNCDKEVCLFNIYPISICSSTSKGTDTISGPFNS